MIVTTLIDQRNPNQDNRIHIKFKFTIQTQNLQGTLSRNSHRDDILIEPIVLSVQSNYLSIIFG